MLKVFNQLRLKDEIMATYQLSKHAIPHDDHDRSTGYFLAYLSTAGGKRLTNMARPGLLASTAKAELRPYGLLYKYLVFVSF